MKQFLNSLIIGLVLLSSCTKTDNNTPKEDDENAPKSPGMKYKHYAPQGKMTVFEGKSCREEIEKRIREEKNKKILLF